MVRPWINLDPGCGKTVAIVGRSGGGKATLLRVQASLEQGSGGNLALAGLHLTNPSFAERFGYPPRTDHAKEEKTSRAAG